MFLSVTRLAVALSALSLSVPAAARGKPGWIDVSATYTMDLMAVSSGTPDRQIVRLDNLDLIAAASLDRFGWSGARLHFHVLGNSGGRPNDRAGTLQGINNIEVPRASVRLFEAWIEQELGQSSLRAGLYDLNNEFYATESSGLFIAPPFGIGSELAATGPNGPSIFPSTALAVRLDTRVGNSGIVRAAAINASARTIGDRGGMDWSFNDGLLLIAEGGIEDESGKLVVGAWRFGRQQDDVRELRETGDPRSRRAQGVYLLGEKPLGERVTVFVRAGFSDGRTTVFRGGWQGGMQWSPVFQGHKESALALGAHQAFLSRGARRNLAEDDIRPARTETGLEISYSDRLFGPVTVQPDLQLIFNRGGDRKADGMLVAGLRLTLEL